MVTDASCEEHHVTVQDGYFSPNDLTVYAGDTVVWTYRGGPGGCTIYGCQEPTQHTVTADDGSWSSGAPSSNFQFQQTFNDPGTVYYHCSVHSQPGRDIGQFMNGRITVLHQPAVFDINPGVTDAWYDDATTGQGFFIIVFEDTGIIFMAWFTYDTERPPQDVMALLGEPGHRWVTAQGPYDGDTANLIVYLTEGGVFDSEVPEPEDPVPVGTITIVWHDCEHATLTYDIDPPGVMGQIEITRIVPDNVALCEALSQQ